METNKAEGTVQQISGKVQDAVGSVMGDAGTQVAGKAKELGGKAQQLYADTADIVRDKTTDNPFTALAIVGGLGFLLGALWASANSAPPRRNTARYRGDEDNY
ncbi:MULTISPECIES: CsbD family protein [unclassified Caballeronia]|uniref:CsbD family protein n=1 Tax=unclassified Caballeronia TaxID=2646786 RepID=UPI0028616323|nr:MULTISPECIES: CsbD family protein [unclassified Caballeronia]MDR5776556.1 CsbD family protein [Caballeronia sp. LZ002]MDR5851993.1 CsbD family protein [Caballeronia sp. LZ003]